MKDLVQLILFAGLAAFIVYRFYAQLGNKSGNEEDLARDWKASPPKNANEEKPPVQSRNPVLKDDSMPPGLEAIQKADANFELSVFLEGAQQAFEMILEAFSKGDRDTLQGLLARDVLQNFNKVIEERERREEVLETALIGFRSVEVVKAELQEDTAFVIVRYISEQGFELKNKEGDVIDSTGAEIEEIVDIWTFARKISAQDPNWVLIKTDSEEPAKT